MCVYTRECMRTQDFDLGLMMFIRCAHVHACVYVCACARARACVYVHVCVYCVCIHVVCMSSCCASCCVWYGVHVACSHQRCIRNAQHYELKVDHAVLSQKIPAALFMDGRVPAALS